MYIIRSFQRIQKLTVLRGQMDSRYLGELKVSAIGLGCLSMTPFYGDPPDANEAIATLHRAAELGINLIDTADFYGGGENERLIGRALRGRRDKYIVSTKFGQILKSDGALVLNGRPEWALQACEASLRRLNIDAIDLYYLHRVDPSVPIEESVGAMAQLVKQGKVRYIGLSEASAATLRSAHKVYTITALQTEYSLWTRDVEGGLLDACKELKVGFVAYSPMGRGFLASGVTSIEAMSKNDRRREMPRFGTDNFTKNLRLLDNLQKIAKDEGATPAQISIAWLLSRKSPVVPIPGTSKIRRLEENAASVHLTLSEHTLAELDRVFDAKIIAGARYSDFQMSRVDQTR
jgi:aryl-alcohol dehydrogenase-like predicted oxidoreductase